MSYSGIDISYMNSLAVANGAYRQLELDLKCPIYVFVNPKHLTSEVEGYSLVTARGQTNSILGYVDHPFFASTRRYLHNNGWIEMQPNWWNGDRVLAPFYFNNVLLEEGDQFTCGSAARYKFSDTYNDGIPCSFLVHREEFLSESSI